MFLCFLKEINTFIQQGCVQLIKSASKDDILLEKIYITGYKKILSSTTVSNIDHNSALD